MLRRLQKAERIAKTTKIKVVKARKEEGAGAAAWREGNRATPSPLLMTHHVRQTNSEEKANTKVTKHFKFDTFLKWKNAAKKSWPS